MASEFKTTTSANSPRGKSPRATTSWQVTLTFDPGIAASINGSWSSAGCGSLTTGREPVVGKIFRDAIFFARMSWTFGETGCQTASRCLCVEWFPGLAEKVGATSALQDAQQTVGRTLDPILRIFL